MLISAESKELTPEGSIHRYRVLAKYQFGDTIGEAIWCAFLYYLVPCEDKLMVVQIDIRWVWDPKYHYCLDLTNIVPIQAKPTHLQPKEAAYLDANWIT